MITDNEEITVALDQGEGITSKATDLSQPGPSSAIGAGHGEDDSQQAAEAMVQLSGIGFYTQPQDESVDLDPNYDPSDFLTLPPSQPPPLEHTMKQEQIEVTVAETLNVSMEQLQSAEEVQQSQEIGIHDDLAVSDSDEEENLKMEIYKEEPMDNDGDGDDDGEGLWF